MRRMIDFLIGNVREHLILYLVLSALLALIDVAYLLRR
jgi:hypothetical protein